MFQKFFQIYPGEEKSAVLFGVLGFLWALAASAGLKYADVALLIHVGAQALPLAYTFIACSTLILSGLLLYAFHVFDTSRIFFTVLAVGIAFYVTAYMALSFQIGVDSQWLWFVLKIVGSIFYAMLSTCFWTFIDQYHHIQDSKRRYSLFNAAIFLGMATTGMLMQIGVGDLKTVVAGVAILLVITFLWIRRINARLKPIPDETASEGGGSEATKSLRFFVRGVLSSPFTMLLMAGSFCLQLLMVIAEYNYMSAFDTFFHEKHLLGLGGETENALTHFLGGVFSSIHIGNLIVGLFLYGRLVRRFGAVALLPVSPILLLATFSGLTLSDALIFPIMGVIFAEGTAYVIDDCNFNLMLNAVPGKIKYRIRVMIESFFEPIATLISAFLITVFQSNSKWVGLGLSAALLGFAVAMQTQYLKGIFQNLAENVIHFQRSVLEWLSKLPKKQQKLTENRLLAMLKIGDSKSQILACEGLLACDDINLLHKILQRAEGFDVATKIRFVKMIEASEFATDSHVLDQFHVWMLEDFDQKLTSLLHFYLAKQGLLHPEKVIDDLESDDLMRKGAAIMALKKSFAQQSPTTAAYHRALAAQHVQLLLDSDHDEEIALGLRVLGEEASPSDVDIVAPFLKNPSIEVARAAAESFANIADKQSIRYAPLLIAQLERSKDNEFRLSCLKALGEIADSSMVRDIMDTTVHFRPSERRMTESIIYKMGLRTVPALLAVTKDTSMHDRCRVLAGHILARLALPQLRANLYEIIENEIERAYFYFYYHHTIQEENKTLDLAILKAALLTSYDSVLDFIIQMLGVAESLEDAELLSRSLRSRNLKVRGVAIETIERSSPPTIFRLLYPLISDMPREEKLRAYLRDHAPITLTELLDKLDTSASLADQIVSATYQYHLELPHWRESLRQQMSRNEEIFHHFAYELLET